MAFLLTVAGIWAVAAMTPGPNFLVVVRCALSGDRSLAFASVAGTVAGTLVWGLAGWLGVSAVFLAAPTAFILVKFIGGAYVVWLGLKLLWQARQSSKDPAPRSDDQLDLSLGKAFRLGLLTNLANPKSAVFVASLFAAALPADYHWSYGLTAVGIMVAISTTWYLLISVLLTNAVFGAAYHRARRRIDVLTGLVFVGFGAKLVTSQH